MPEIHLTTPRDGRGFVWRALGVSLSFGVSCYVLTHYFVEGSFGDSKADFSPRFQVLFKHVREIAFCFGSLFAFAVVSIRRRRRSSIAQRFFRIPSKGQISIVVSTVRHAKPGKTAPKQSSDQSVPRIEDRYYKEDSSADGGKRFVWGTDVVVGLPTLQSAMSAFREFAPLLPLCRTIIESDDEVIQKLKLGSLDSSVYLCLGSPRTNGLAEYLWQRATLSTSPGTHRFGKNATMKCNGTGEELKLDDSLDHAVVVKLTEHDKVFLICAGIGGDGTTCAVQWLLDHWKKLERSIKTKDFYRHLRARRSPKIGEAMVEVEGRLLVKQPHEEIFNPVVD